MRRVAHLALAGALLLSNGAWAQDEEIERQVAPNEQRSKGLHRKQASLKDEAASTPTVTGSVDVEIHSDWTYRGGDKGNRVFTDTDATLGFFMNRQFSLQSTFHLEPARDTGEEGFRKQSLYLEQLYLLYDDGRYAGYAGKFNANFGLAWDKAPGVFGTDFAEDYEFNEKLGIGASAVIDLRQYGRHEIGFSVFKNDTSPLSYSVLDRRFSNGAGVLKRRNQERYDGAGNTNSFGSFALTLFGEDIGPAPGLTYHLGLIHEKGDGNAKDETGAVFGAQYILGPIKDFAIVPLFEVAHFRNYGGEDDRRLYVTGGLGIAYGKWSASTSGTYRRIRRPSGTPGAKDHLFQVSAGYEILPDLVANIGWKTERIERERQQTLGLLLGYSYDF